MDEKATIYFDGACLPRNPGGIATYGYVIFWSDKKFEGSGVVAENSTNNVAEYSALIEAVRKALSLGIKKVMIRGDSQLVIRQLLGVYAVRSPRILPLYDELSRLLDKFDDVELEWVPRKQNAHADALSTKAYLDYMYEKQVQRALEIKDEEIKQLDEIHFKVRSYDVNVEKPSCTCPAFANLNKYYLLKRDNIIVPCKHIIAVMLLLKNR